MFLTLARMYAADDKQLDRIQQLPASQLSRWLEEIWYHASLTADNGFPNDGDFGTATEEIRLALGHPQATPDAEHDMAPSGLLPLKIPDPVANPREPGPFTLRAGPLDPVDCGPRIWQHLIYAYLLESTGLYDVLAEVARRLVAGDSLGVLSRESIVWLRNTEELFFRDPPLFGVTGVLSELRPSRAVNRRNVYWRMFGMDIPHQVPAGWPGSGQPDDWKARAGDGYNGDFQEKLSELLRQVWLGIINNRNTIGPDPTDPGYLALLCEAIGDMLRKRRLNGLLAREEFVYVSSLSWFHLTLLVDSPLVRDLQVQGSAPEQRLLGLAQKVGMKSAARSRELFQLCELMSTLLRSIELRAFDTAEQARLLFTDRQLVEDMRRIINLWQSATGQRIKDKDAVPSTTSTQPLRAPTPAASMAQAGAGSSKGSSNGSTPGGR